MKAIIIYQSKYGSTRQYAEWIHEEIPSEITDFANTDNVDWQNYDVIVFGTHFHNSRILGRKYLQNK